MTYLEGDYSGLFCFVSIADNPLTTQATLQLLCFKNENAGSWKRKAEADEGREKIRSTSVFAKSGLEAPGVRVTKCSFAGNFGMKPIHCKIGAYCAYV
jgi:hypothetical protein